MTEKEIVTIPRKAKTPKRPKKASKKASKKILDIATAVLDDDKAIDVVVIDLAGKTSFADYMVIASGTSQRHVATMAVHLREKMKTAENLEIPIEGTTQNDWVLVDGGDVIVHLFRPEIREFYDLEKLWSTDMPKPGEVA